MKKLFVIIAMVAIAALISLPVSAQNWSNTYYGQEGTANDGYLGIDASGHGPAKDVTDNYTNWKYQYGNNSWSGIYSWDGDAWLTIVEDGPEDGNLDVEADIEMYIATTMQNHKMYFHIGNIYTANENDLTAFATGTVATNHPMYLGISFDGLGKDVDNFDITTGKIIDAMVGSKDNGGRLITDTFDAVILLDYGSGYLKPTSFGNGAHDTLHNVLWWAPFAGVHNLSWLVRLYPNADQADGNYHLDPTFVVAPEL